jgi:hypothetical protein
MLRLLFLARYCALHHGKIVNVTQPHHILDSDGGA